MNPKLDTAYLSIKGKRGVEFRVSTRYILVHKPVPLANRCDWN